MKSFKGFTDNPCSDAIEFEYNVILFAQAKSFNLRENIAI